MSVMDLMSERNTALIQICHYQEQLQDLFSLTHKGNTGTDF